ncbi:MAG: hypothetical protein WBB74_01170 [Gaiellaceae bacterium]
MADAASRAKLVDAARDFDGRGVTTTIPRDEVERALRSKESPELFIDVARVPEEGGADVEAHTISVAWDRQDLEELLRTTEGDEIALQFDRQELEQALEESDVEAHGLRERVLVLTVAATAAAGIAGQAAARPFDTGGGSPPAIEMISDAASSGSATGGLTAQQIWDSAPQSVRAASSAEITPLISDAASSGPQTGGLTAKQIWDSAPQSVRDASSAAIRDQAGQPTAGGGGVDISAPSPSTAGIAGGIALLIMGAGFSVRGQRRRAPRPT